jgi:pimeloyl-ACP methyl ester carboxylesterase
VEYATSSDGTRIAFDAVGSGPALVLVGGAFQTRTDQLMAGLTSALAGARTVVAYDRRGRGGSGDAATYRPEAEHDDLDAVITAVGGGADVFGMSSGAVLALEATARGVPARALVLYEPPVIADESRPPVARDEADLLRRLVARGDRDTAVARFLAGPVGLPEAVVEGMRGAPFWPAMTALAHTLPYDGALMRPYQQGLPLEAPWGRLAVPVLVADGSASPPWIRAGAAAVAAAIPGSSRRTLEGQAHDVDPALLGNAIAAFLDALGS